MIKNNGFKNTYLSGCGLGLFSLLILVRAAAASSRAQETLDVSLLSTSGSASCLPSPVASFPIPSASNRRVRACHPKQ